MWGRDHLVDGDRSGAKLTAAIRPVFRPLRKQSGPRYGAGVAASHSARGRIRTAAGLALAGVVLAGCSDRSHYTALESNGDADLRVVIALPSAGTPAISLLTRDEPFRYPLAQLFGAEGQSLRVVVVAYALADLEAQFQRLAGHSADEVKSLITPRLGAPGPGAFVPPAPLRILATTVDEGGATDLRYQPMSTAELAADPALQFTFAVAAPIACAPGENDFRLFSRADPARVCPFHRDATCAWVPRGSSGCADLPAILGRADATAGLHEVPPQLVRTATESLTPPRIAAGTPVAAIPPRFLTDGKGVLVCPNAAITASAGESLRFDCGTSAQASLQEGRRDTTGAPAPPALGSPAVISTADGWLGPASSGALYAAPNGASVGLTRLDSAGAPMPAMLVDATTMHAEQLQLDLSLLARPPQPAALRLSADRAGILTVVSGHDGAVVLVGDRSPLVTPMLNFFLLPFPVPKPAVGTRVGDVVAGPSPLHQVYALTSSGALASWVLQGTAVVPAGPLLPAAPLPGTPRLAVVENGAGAEIVIAWSADQVRVFDPGRSRVVACTTSGRILAGLDGPVLARVPPDLEFAIDLIDLEGAADGGACEGARAPRRILVPPSATPAASAVLEVDDGAFLAASGGRRLLAYHYDDPPGSDGTPRGSVGVLDVDSGLSAAMALDRRPERTVAFEDATHLIWVAAMAAGDTRLALARFPE